MGKIKEPKPPAPFPKREGGVGNSGNWLSTYGSITNYLKKKAPPSFLDKGDGGLGPSKPTATIFVLRAVTLAGFVLTIFAGLFGSVVGSHNFAIIFVWIAWWTLLKLVLIPLGGRSWCAVCPIPMPGEWLTQGAVFPGHPKTRRGMGLGLKWPTSIRLPLLGAVRLRGNWLQAGGFLLIGLFSAVTLTTPMLTGWVLLGILVLATALALIFDKAGQPSRPFCNSLCPIGGFSGLYAQAAPVEVRARDLKVCAAHSEKTCYEACPWGVYVAALQDNTNCGLCMECIRVCPNANVSLNLREFGRDFIQSKRALRLDEAYLALVMLGSVLGFSAVFLGPWGWLRRAAYAIGSVEWMLYGAAFLIGAGLVIPGLYALALRLGGPVRDWKKALGRFARPLLPLGLAAWIAFTIAFAFAKLSYVAPVLADPFGLGWNLLGGAGVSFNPDVSIFSPVLQTTVLVIGLLFTAWLARKDADTPRRTLAVQSFALVIVLGMLALLI